MCISIVSHYLVGFKVSKKGIPRKTTLGGVGGCCNPKTLLVTRTVVLWYRTTLRLKSTHINGLGTTWVDILPVFMILMYFSLGPIFTSPPSTGRLRTTQSSSGTQPFHRDLPSSLTVKMVIELVVVPRIIFYSDSCVFGLVSWTL